MPPAAPASAANLLTLLPASATPCFNCSKSAAILLFGEGRLGLAQLLDLGLETLKCRRRCWIRVDDLIALNDAMILPYNANPG